MKSVSVKCRQSRVSETSCLKLKREVSRKEKKVQDCDCVIGSSTTFQRRKEWICESRCCQVSVRLHVFAGFVLPLTLPWLQFLHFPRSAFYPSLHFTLSLQSAFYPWSAVCSPQSTVYVLHWPFLKYFKCWWFCQFHSKIHWICLKKEYKSLLAILNF